MNSEDGNIYVIYDFGRAYPEYLIDFQLWNKKKIKN